MSAGSFGSQGPQTAEDCGDPKPPEDHQVSCVGEHLRGIRQGSQGRRTRISQGVPPAASVTGKNVINKFANFYLTCLPTKVDKFQEDGQVTVQL